MNNPSHRPYRDSSDIAKMKRIAGRVFSRVPSHPFGGLEWVVFGPHGFPPHEVVEMWEDGRGEAIGWALLGSADSFDYRVVPDALGTPIEEAILRWGMRRILAWRAANGLDARCGVDCWGGDQSRIEILARHGFRATDRGGVLFSQGLERDIPPPRAPDGWTVRGVTDADIDDRARTQFEAFSPGSKTTPATWRHLMANATGYDADLDNIAVAADATVGAAALAWLDNDDKCGEFEPVGTRPAFQRRGLGKAVLLRGLAQMRERGMETAIVGTNATNTAAIALYQSVGFTIVNRMTEYELTPETPSGV